MATRPRSPRRRPAEPDPPRDRRSPAAALVAALIVVAVAWAYGNSLHGVLALDDVRAIARNETIRSWSTALAPPPASTVSGRPLANLSFALNYALAPQASRDVFEAAGAGATDAAAARFRQNVLGYHALNLAIHAACGLLLFGVVRRTLGVERLRPSFGPLATWIAGGVALTWVVHPLTTAAVTYLVQRVESLMSLWYLLTLYCAIRAWDVEEARPGTWQAAALASCACGMATKEVMVTAPVTVALWGYLFGRRDASSAWRLPAALAATWCILGLLVFGERRGPSIDLAPEMVWRYLITQAGVILHYLRLSIVPHPLAFLYDWPIVASVSEVLVPALVVATAAGATLFLVVRRHPAAFPAASFFLVLAPSSSVLPIATEVAAEHRMYLPLAAVVAGAGIALVAGVLRWRRTSGTGASSPGGAEPGVPLVAVVVVAVVVGGLSLMTRARNEVYASEVSLWADNVAARPADPRPRVAYGGVLARAGRIAEAEGELQVAVSLAPDNAVARVRLGSVLASQNKADAAITHLEAALSLSPNDVDAHRFLGEIYAAKRQDALAVTHYERVHAAYPEDVMMAVRLASLLATARDPMVRNPQRALDLAAAAAAGTGRRDPRILEVLSAAQAGMGSLSTAAATAREAAALARASGDATYASALEYRASTYGQSALQAVGPRR